MKDVSTHPAAKATTTATAKDARRDDKAAAVLTAPLQVGSLPSFAFGTQSILWWATLGLVLIEGTVFALALATYFYLRSHSQAWPPSSPPPALLWGTVNTAILLVSMLPNHWAKRASEQQDLRKSRLWLCVCLVFSLAFLAVRAFEFGALNVRWDADAYGSIVWTLLGLHTVHLVTDTYDSIVLAVLLFIGPLESKRFVDVNENADYWYFVVLSWLPIYAVIYWAPRFHG